MDNLDEKLRKLKNLYNRKLIDETQYKEQQQILISSWTQPPKITQTVATQTIGVMDTVLDDEPTSDENATNVAQKDTFSPGALKKQEILANTPSQVLDYKKRPTDKKCMQILAPSKVEVSDTKSDKVKNDGTYVKLEIIQGSKLDPNTFYEHDTLMVGRGSSTNCRVLQDRYASRIHCVLEMNPPKCLIKDLGSRNGTFINGQKYGKGEGVFLKDGDVLKVGRTVLKVKIHTVDVVDENYNETLFEDDRPEYERLEKVSEGPWTIYKAQNVQTKEYARLKVMEIDNSFSKSRLKRFFEQIQFLHTLVHPNICLFYSGDCSGNELYLATEWVDAKSIWDEVRLVGTFSEQRAKKIILQLFKALEYAHQQKIVHRKIHPKNIYITPDDVVKIVDFGLGMHFDMAGLSGLSLYEEEEEDILFTPPEQIQEYRLVDPRSDLYSAGALFFYMLTGKPIFDVANSDLMFAILDERTKPCSVSEFVQVSHQVESIISRCLIRNMEQRFKNAQEVVHMLENL
ncbi:FHA domain-containing serine/threonine-protein kinase [Candidatus Uabimicrobium amorphum]|uniref:Serine/threonine protein kinase n=1 Tax=Uabimicrobium amorphum TaxID=2596890 RepID=A0A5S9F508_UABAM|nr:FHA domain-containing serine/threonine-protein kinase [Candidatus Uabimicrobium amorphum]BBM86346.1 serine/threonine protein kinase [Candidatus Uabimicrobium amorphum]